MPLLRTAILTLMALAHSTAIAEPVVSGALISGGTEGDCPLLL